jgi:hypothetical protein
MIGPCPQYRDKEIGSPHGLFDGNLSGHFCVDKNRNRRVRDENGRPRMPQFAGLGRRGAACPLDGPDSRAGRLRIATLVHGTLKGPRRRF